MPAIDGGRLREALARGPILLDAAMGIRLIARGLDLTIDDPSAWSLDRPEVVLAIHQLDVDAGSGALLTNTFGANRTWLARYGRTGDVGAINRSAVALARLAAGNGRIVLGSIGPTASDHPRDLVEQAEILVDAGVDALILETHLGAQAIRALETLEGRGIPILASLVDWPDPIGPAARRLVDLGAVAIGANCVVGMARALELAGRLREAVGEGFPLLLKPSAGLPGSKPEPPEAFGAAVPELVALGVRLIGGCCGTTEAHVSALRLGLRNPNPNA